MPPRRMLPLIALALLFWSAGPAGGLVVVGQTQATPFMRAVAIEREGSFLFVAGGPAGMVVFDATEVRAPIEVGAWDAGEPVYAVSVSGNLAAASLADGVVLLDVTDRHEPREVARLVVDGAEQLDLVDSRLYVAWETGSGAEQVESGLRVFDVTDPAAPRTVGSWSAQEFLGGFTVRAGLAAFSSFQIIASTSEGRLRILDTNGDDPVPTGRFDAPGSFARPVWVGSLVFVPIRSGRFQGSPGLRVLEVPENGDPFERGLLTTHRDVARALVRGDLAVLALASGGILLADVSDPAAPAPRGELAPPGREADFADVVWDGAYLQVASGQSVATVSLADPDHPRRLGRAPLPDEPRYSFPHPPNTVVVEESRAYVTTDTRKMHVLDLSDPAAPDLRSTVDLRDPAVIDLVATDAAASGMYAFVSWKGFTSRAQSAGGLQVFDATDPDAPALVAELNTLGRCDRIIRDGTMLVIGCEGFVHLVDVADPRSPRVRSSIPLSFGSLQSLAQADAYVYAGWQYTFLPNPPSGMPLFGTTMIGVEDPDAPVDGPQLPFFVRGIALRDELAFVGSGGVFEVFSSDLTAEPLATIPVSAEHVRDTGRLVALGGRAGLQVIDLPAPDRARALGGVATQPDFDRLGALWVAPDSSGLNVFDLGAEYTASDRDADGRLDALDACPDQAGEFDGDLDRDGTGDACDPTPVPEPGAGGVALAVVVLASLRCLRSARRGVTTRRGKQLG